MPASRRSSSIRFFTIRPAPTSSANAMAISPMTRPLPNVAPPLPVRVSPSRSAVVSVARRSRSSGDSPQTIPTTIDSDRRERQHAAVDLNRRGARQAVAGEHDEHAHDPDRQQQPERAARHAPAPAPRTSAAARSAARRRRARGGPRSRAAATGPTRAAGWRRWRTRSAARRRPLPSAPAAARACGRR